MLSAPATSPAMPARKIVWRSEVAPATPITMPAMETMPSLAPSTAARSRLSRLFSELACGSSACWLISGKSPAGWVVGEDMAPSS